MTMQYIRDYYGVPAKRGMSVRYSPPNKPPREGKIIRSEGQYIVVQLDPRPGWVQKTTIHHPTWCIEYLNGDTKK